MDLSVAAGPERVLYLLLPVNHCRTAQLDCTGSLCDNRCDWNLGPDERPPQQAFGVGSTLVASRLRENRSKQYDSRLYSRPKGSNVFTRWGLGCKWGPFPWQPFGRTGLMMAMKAVLSIESVSRHSARGPRYKSRVMQARGYRTPVKRVLPRNQGQRDWGTICSMPLPDLIGLGIAPGHWHRGRSLPSPCPSLDASGPTVHDDERSPGRVLDQVTAGRHDKGSVTVSERNKKV